jgi:hypothetical protein
MHLPQRDTGKNLATVPVFIIFIDAIFTTLLAPPFTKLFDVSGGTHANPCLCRACNAG